MHKAWFLGFFILTPSLGHAVSGFVPAHYPGFQKETAAVDESLKITPVSLPERLGEDLRDAVAEPPTLECFLEAMRRPEPRARIAALEAFGYEDNFAAIPYVSAILLRLDEQVTVRVAAAQALGRIADRRSWKFLAGALRDTDARVRFHAALALGNLGSRRAVSLLVRPLCDASPEVRAAAGLALGRLGASAILRRALDLEPDGGVRAVLSLSLEQARPRRS